MRREERIDGRVWRQASQLGSNNKCHVYCEDGSEGFCSVGWNNGRATRFGPVYVETDFDNDGNAFGKTVIDSKPTFE